MFFEIYSCGHETNYPWYLLTNDNFMDLISTECELHYSAIFRVPTRILFKTRYLNHIIVLVAKEESCLNMICLLTVFHRSFWFHIYQVTITIFCICWFCTCSQALVFGEFYCIVFYLFWIQNYIFSKLVPNLPCSTCPWLINYDDFVVLRTITVFVRICFRLSLLSMTPCDARQT